VAADVAHLAVAADLGYLAFAALAADLAALRWLPSLTLLFQKKT
jgi:hypothetical protein